MNEVSRAIELREIVTSLGPAYIKLGQALSIRLDILLPTAITELQKLCNKQCLLSRRSLGSHGVAFIQSSLLPQSLLVNDLRIPGTSVQGTTKEKWEFGSSKSVSRCCWTG